MPWNKGKKGSRVVCRQLIHDCDDVVQRHQDLLLQLLLTLLLLMIFLYKPE
jgi:hypothetical protein